MDDINDVSVAPSHAVSEDVSTQMDPVVAPVAATHSPPPGSQTPESNLLAALKEERARRKEAEDKLNNLATTSSEEFVSDEGKLLAERLAKVEARNKALEDERALERVQNQFPQLKELSAEFTEFIQDYPQGNMSNLAKLFLVEKGMLEGSRKGLEKPTGGPRTPALGGMTSEEVDNLRKNDWRKYRELLMKDQLKVVN